MVQGQKVKLRVAVLAREVEGVSAPAARNVVGVPGLLGMECIRLTDIHRFMSKKSSV